MEEKFRLQLILLVYIYFSLWKPLDMRLHLCAWVLHMFRELFLDIGFE